MTTDYKQDKLAELAFFSGHAAVDEYDVFTEPSTRKLFGRCMQLARLKPATFVADIGCGSGVFSQLLRESGVNAIGLDLSHPLLVLGRHKYPGVNFVVGDAGPGTLDWDFRFSWPAKINASWSLISTQRQWIRFKMEVCHFLSMMPNQC
jgi:SAM-dependent methyltransferase